MVFKELVVSHLAAQAPLIITRFFNAIIEWPRCSEATPSCNIRAFLIFLFFLINLKIPTCRGIKNQKADSNAEQK